MLREDNSRLFSCGYKHNGRMENIRNNRVNNYSNSNNDTNKNNDSNRDE